MNPPPPGFNQPGFNQQPGYQQMNYGYDPDQYLRDKIEGIFARYDPNFTGFLEQHEFVAFFGELCV